MSNLVRSAQKSIAASKSVSGLAGKRMTVAGGAGIGLWFVAGLIPFISLPMLFVAMVAVGIFMWE